MADDIFGASGWHWHTDFYNLDDRTYSGRNLAQILSMYKCVAEI